MPGRNFSWVGSERSCRLLRRCLPQTLLQFLHLKFQTFGKTVAELGKVFPDRGCLGHPSFRIDAQQLLQSGCRYVQSLGIEVRGFGKQADWRLLSVHLTVAALEDPLQNSAVIPVTRPQELALLLSEPVDIIHLPQFGSVSTASHLEPVRKVVSHVVATEWKHGHRIAPQSANLPGYRGGGLTAGGCAQECAGLPVESLDPQRGDPPPPSAQQDPLNRVALRRLPPRDGHRAILP